MKVIQLRGTNATGKTTAIRQFIEKGEFEIGTINVQGLPIEFHEEKKRGIIILGRYDLSTTGGIDGRITNKTVLRNSIVKILKELKPDVLIFEGIVYGVTFKFAFELYSVLQKIGCDYIGVCLIPPLDIAFKRVAERNGGKQINYMSLQSKWFTAQKSYEMLRRNGVPVVVVDTSKIPKGKMYCIVEDFI